MNRTSTFQDAFLRWAGPSVLSGATLGQWLKVLWRHRFSVDLPFWGRAATITSVSIINSVGYAVEQIRFGKAIRAAHVRPPLFVLGSWRSGTTHLHNLLSKDRRFAFPNTFQVMNPYTFLSTERWNSPVQQRFFPDRRPQDNVRFGVREPQEDEFAIAAMNQVSMMLSWVFCRDDDFYDRFMTLRRATDLERERWRQAVVHFVKKLSYKYDRPLVMKSPAHTGRVALLLDLFPDARFVMIHRHPYDIFSSTVHTMSRVIPLCALQRYSTEGLIESSIDKYTELMDAYFDERTRIPEGRLTEIGFDQLERAPLETLRHIYAALDLPEFSQTEPDMVEYLGTLKEYQKNRHAEIPDEQRQMINDRWSRSFDEWGYDRV